MTTEGPVESAWCEVSPARIAQNLRHVLKRLPPQTRLCAVVKADAYGHGIENTVSLLMAQGITSVGISANAEARALRDAGFDGVILRLRTATPDEVAGAVFDGVEEQVGSLKGLLALRARLGEGRLPKLHLSLNAGGMSRDALELSTPQGRRDCAEIVAMAAGRIVGICTHFPSNQEHELAASINRFQRDLAWVFANSGLRRCDVVTHAGSTLTLCAGLDPQVDMMRIGALLFGIAAPGPDFGLAMALKSRVISLGSYPKGSTIGYDRTTTLSRESVLASVALGYANGYRRQLSPGGEVLIRGQLCPVLGEVSMNTLVADVSAVPAVALNDEVVAFGHQQGRVIEAQSMERLSGTILADLFTDWGLRNRRIPVGACDLCPMRN